LRDFQIGSYKDFEKLASVRVVKFEVEKKSLTERIMLLSLNWVNDSLMIPSVKDFSPQALHCNPILRIFNLELH
jgi:hypothetical protein